MYPAIGPRRNGEAPQRLSLKILLRVVPALGLLCCLGLPFLGQEGAAPPAEKGKGKAKGGGKAKQEVPARPVEPAPRWADGRVNLGSAPGKGQTGYWELRPGANGMPRPDAVPFQPWAKAVYDYRQATNTKDSPLVDCKAATGLGFLNAPGFEIVDTPELKEVFILNIAGPHSWRVIYTDGRSHPKGEDLRPTYLGHSIGHWEGDTLMIDSVGFNEKQWAFGSYPTTEQLHLTEKISRPSLGSLLYEATIDDPGAYTKPWSATLTINERGLSRFVPNGEPFEYICEDNR